jgi:hypothetical protein
MIPPGNTGVGNTSLASGHKMQRTDPGSFGCILYTSLLASHGMQMKAVRLRESKFGLALVLETTPQSGGYVLGFRVDPKETLDYVYKEISSLWQVRFM